MFSGTLVGVFLGLFLGLVLGLVLELKASADLFTPALSLLECIRKQGLSLARHYITQMQRYEVLTRLQLIYILETKTPDYAVIQLKLTVDLVQLQGSWCTPKERCHSFDVILWPMQPFLLDFLGDQSSETPRSNVEKNCRCNDSNCFWLKRLTNLDRSFVFFWCQLSHPIFLKLFRSIHCSLPTTSVSKLFLFVYQPRDVQDFSRKCQEKGFI